MTQVTSSPNSPLSFYNEVAEDLYMSGGYESDHEVEERTYETAKKKLDPPAVRAEMLALSAGRLSKVDPAAAKRAWDEALVAAGQIAEYARTRGFLDNTARVAPPVFVQKDQVAQMQQAFGADNDRDVRSYVFQGVALMLFQVGEIAPGLQAAQMINRAADRVSFLLTAATELIEQHNFDGAKQSINQMHNDVIENADDSSRFGQLAYIALLEARLGLYRASRVTCPNLVSTELSCYSEEPLRQYKVRENPSRYAKLEDDYGFRYQVDW